MTSLRRSSIFQKRVTDICMIVAMMMSFGYPIQIAIPVILKLDIGTSNFIIRALYALVLISVYIIGLTSRTISFKTKTWTRPLLFFWLFYIIRLIYDLSINNLKFDNRSSFWVYSMAIGNGLLPYFIISSFINKIDYYKLIEYIYITTYISIISIFLLLYIKQDTLSVTLLQSRVGITGEQENQLVIHPIIIGTYGNALLVMSILRLIYFKLKLSYKVISIIGIFFGSTCLALGGSRGPVLVLAILILILITFQYFFSKKLLTTLASTSAICFITILSFTSFISKDFAIFYRFQNFFNERKLGIKEARDFEWEYAFAQFVENPILGDQFLNRYDNYYPHNIFLEVLMALGIVGCIPFLRFLYLFFKELYKTFIRRDKEKFFICLSVLSICLSTLTSGGLFTIPFFWASIPLIFVKYNSRRSVSIPSNYQKSHLE